MGRVEFDPAAVLQDFRTSYQRDIVKMDDIKALCKDPADVARLEKRGTGLVSGKGGQNAEGACQPMDGYTRVIVIVLFYIPPRQEAEGVRAVDHIDPMTSRCQFVRQPMDENTVTTEIERRIEGCYHAETERTIHRILITLRRDPLGIARMRRYQGKSRLERREKRNSVRK